MKNWYGEMASFLGGWPESYLVFDLETNGLDPRSPETLPIQLGWARVEGRKLASSGEVILDWTQDGYHVDRAWLADSIDAVRRRMNSRGREYHCSMAQMREEGVDPREGIAQYVGLLQDAQAAGRVLAGHNCWAYDRPLLERVARQYCQINYTVALPTLDTGMVEKARMLKAPPPLPGEVPVNRWYERIHAARSRVKWNLDQHVTEVYGLPVDQAKAHLAGYDCELVHRFIEAIRVLAGVAT